MSRWTHALCTPCWNARHPGRQPHGLLQPEIERCCYCDSETTSGIYDRNDPAATPCGGIGGSHDDQH